jgi:nudix motif 8
MDDADADADDAVDDDANVMTSFWKGRMPPLLQLNHRVIDAIKYRLEQHQTIQSLAKWKYRVDPPKQAAVLLPLCNINGEMSILFTVRSPALRSHAGQVSFPGKRDDRPHPDHRTH